MRSIIHTDPTVISSIFSKKLQLLSMSRRVPMSMSFLTITNANLFRRRSGDYFYRKAARNCSVRREERIRRRKRHSRERGRERTPRSKGSVGYAVNQLANYCPLLTSSDRFSPSHSRGSEYMPWLPGCLALAGRLMLPRARAVEPCD